MTAEFPAYRYVGLDELEDRSHIVVDGAPRPVSALVLSHWPISPTPRHLARDLSAEIARAYLGDEGAWVRGVDLVTNDHVDLDGLVSLFFLTSPELALEWEELLIEVARVGDFGVVRSMDAARTAWALETLMNDPNLATVGLVDSAINEHSTMTTKYRTLLAVLERYLGASDHYRYLFEPQEERFRASREFIASNVRRTEHPDLDLLVLEVFEAEPIGESERSATALGIDPLAIHSSSDASRILVCRDQSYCLYDRYETWVRFVSRRRELRRDLLPLAGALTGADDVGWSADPPSSIEPELRSSGKSSLATREVIDRVVDYLASAPAAFDPFDESGPLLR